jgi:hypothetical protein
MAHDASTPLLDLTARASRVVQTTVGWIFWDPGAVERYEALGLPAAFASPLGYIAARCAPLAPAGPAAVTAAFGSISPVAIDGLFSFLGDPARFAAFAEARDAAVLEGLSTMAPDLADLLEREGSALWRIVDELPALGRVLFATHRAASRPDHPVLAGWHAVNCIREWRGDTHWAIVVAHGLSHAEASVLHNEWLGYERDWLPNSRGTSEADLAEGWAKLTAKGLVVDGTVTEAAIDLREAIEVETDAASTSIWAAYGEAATRAFCEAAEPSCGTLLEAVDRTAGPNYQPASRTRRRRG